jgi:hypothetical protein
MEMDATSKEQELMQITLTEQTKKEIAELPGNPAFYQSIIKCAEIHARKNVDYSFGISDDKGLSNFIWAAAHAEVTPRQVFSIIIGIKDARLRNLVAKELIGAEKPLNEPVLDTRFDEVNYKLLEAAFQTTYPGLFDKVLNLRPCIAESGQLVS